MAKAQLEFSAGGIIFKRRLGKVLFALIHNSYDQWTFPKGHIEKAEKPEAAALRESREEIGIKKLKIVEKIDKIDYWFKLEGKLYHKFVYFFLMEAPEDAELTPQQEEIKDAEWLEKEECLKRLVYKDDVPMLKKAIKIIEK